MPDFVKTPRFIIGTVVVVWVLYIIYANFQLDLVKFYLLPFNILVLQLKLSAVIIAAAFFGAIATIAIQWLWRRPSNNVSSVTAPTVPPPAPTPPPVTPSSKTVA
jgi:hypothetical protein